MKRTLNNAGPGQLRHFGMAVLHQPRDKNAAEAGSSSNTTADSDGVKALTGVVGRCSLRA